jgi:hypothetical protein
MIVLDEQMREDQRRILKDWRIQFRQIGRELAISGIKDENIIPFLLTKGQRFSPTTKDSSKCGYVTPAMVLFASTSRTSKQVTISGGC